MARYRDTQNDHMKMIPVSFEQQILPDLFEYSLAWLVDNELDLATFDNHYNNDDKGHPDYDPKLLLKIVIFAYSKGITSSRRIERLCRDNITFMALSADTRPHFTAIADFISRSPEAISNLFTQIVLMCDHLVLIGSAMFAINGCKLPSNVKGVERHPRRIDQETPEARSCCQAHPEEEEQASIRPDGFSSVTHTQYDNGGGRMLTHCRQWRADARVGIPPRKSKGDTDRCAFALEGLAKDRSEGYAQSFLETATKTAASEMELVAECWRPRQPGHNRFSMN